MLFPSAMTSAFPNLSPEIVDKSKALRPKKSTALSPSLFRFLKKDLNGVVVILVKINAGINAASTMMNPKELS